MTDDRFVRPAEVDVLVGDATRARTELGWQPEVDFEGLVRMMVRADLSALAGPDDAPEGLAVVLQPAHERRSRTHGGGEALVREDARHRGCGSARARSRAGAGAT